jgi:hypothetical protein
LTFSSQLKNLAQRTILIGVVKDPLNTGHNFDWLSNVSGIQIPTVRAFIPLRQVRQY